MAETNQCRVRLPACMWTDPDRLGCIGCDSCSVVCCLSVHRRFGRRPSCKFSSEGVSGPRLAASCANFWRFSDFQVWICTDALLERDTSISLQGGKPVAQYEQVRGRSDM
eukprot:3851718-Amphidinium_carterae.1